jgi:acyl carrier protein
MKRIEFEEVRDFITATVAPQLPVSATGGDVHLMDAGVIDSVGFVNLIAAIENRFAIEIDLGDADPEQFLTIDGLARCAVSSAQTRTASDA